MTGRQRVQEQPPSPARQVAPTEEPVAGSAPFSPVEVQRYNEYLDALAERDSGVQHDG